MNPKVLNVGLRGITLAVRFALVFVLAFFLSPAEVGLYGLLAVTVSYALYCVGFDFYTFSTRDLLGRPRHQWPRLLLSQGLLFLALYCIVLPGVLFLFANGLLPWRLVGWALVLIVSEHLGQEISRLAIAMGRPLFASILIFVRQGLWALIFVGLLFWQPDFRNLEALLLFWCIGSGTSVLFGALLFVDLEHSRQGLRPDFGWIKQGITVAFPLLMATLALRAIMTIDRYAFEALNGAELLGAYSLFMGMAGAMLTFMDAGVFSFLYPRMIRHQVASEWTAFHRVRRTLKKHTLLWTGVLFSAGALVGPWLFLLLPEPVYFDHWPLFVGLLACMGLFVVGMVPHYGLYSISRDKPIIWAHISGLLVFLLCIGALAEVSPQWAVVIAFGLAAIYIGVFKQIAFARICRNLKIINQN